ncbi:MAG: RNA-processing protein [Candidatus Aenigmatarchaeota archaeon]
MKIEIRVPKEMKMKEKFIKDIEEKLSVKIDLKNYNILEVETNEWYNILRIKEIINALIFGFDENECRKLLKEDYCFQVIEIKKYLKNRENRDRLKELKGRIIGRNGKVKRNIEKLTNSKISIYRNLVGIITDEENSIVARRAIEMLLEGKEHSTVYSFLNREIQRKNYRFKNLKSNI